MENASKALLMAGEILIGILLLFILVYFSRMASSFTNQIDSNIATKQIQEFNAKFEKYNNKDNLTPQDIVTLSNIVRDYNGKKDFYTQISITITGVESRYKNKIQQGFSQEEGAEFMTNYAPKADEENLLQQSTFSCIMGYDVKSGTINKIELSLNK